MRILYVVGSCLQRNTSANMSHNSYIQGLLENGHSVDIIMAKDSFGVVDNCFPKFSQAKYFEYDSTPRINFLRDVVKGLLRSNRDNIDKVEQKNIVTEQSVGNNDTSLFKLIKKIYNKIFINDNLYYLDRRWLKTAMKFRSNQEYDYIISNSSPASSHKLVLKLRKKIKYKKWIQIWEDPWFFDIYGEKDERIFNEESNLLSGADKIFYVSPLTLEYQKKYFKKYADKMNVIPLPYFKVNEGKTPKEISLGYFGDYYSKTRNLKPFYETVKQLKMKCYIYGDSDENFKSNDYVKINGRVTLEELNKVENDTYAYVSLCNLKGGQIPGKIYHYSATSKPILFILDGTKEEILTIKNFFEKYNRYYFCENNIDSITKAIIKLANNNPDISNKVVEEFSPYNVINNMFSKL